MSVLLRLGAVAVPALAAALGTGVATADAATAMPARPAAVATCPDGWCGLWGTVEANPTVNIRSTPYVLPNNINGVGRYQDPVEVRCYKVGQTESGWGGTNPYWDLITDTNTGVAGYAADVWIDTGGTITSQVRACPS